VKVYAFCSVDYSIEDMLEHQKEIAKELEARRAKEEAQAQEFAKMMRVTTSKIDKFYSEKKQGWDKISKRRR